MKSPAGKAALEQLKKPPVLLAGTAAFCMVLLALLAWFWILPVRSEYNRVKAEVDFARNQASMVEARAVPAKVSDEEVQSLLQELPLKVEVPRLLQELRKLADASEIKLLSVQVGDAPSKNSQLEELIIKSQQSPSPQATPAPSAGAVSPAAGAAPSGGTAGQKSKVSEEKILLSLEAPYVNAMDFLRKLYEIRRIVTILEWSMKQEGIVPEGGIPSLGTLLTPKPSATPSKSGETRIRLDMTLGIYSAPEFSGKLKDLPLPQVSPGAQRKDPTWTDEMLYELLLQEQP